MKTTDTFFIGAVDNLDIEPYILHNKSTTENTQDIVNKYENHPSKIKIKENIKDKNIFSFKDSTPEEFKFQIKKLDAKKSYGRK